MNILAINRTDFPNIHIQFDDETKSHIYGHYGVISVPKNIARHLNGAERCFILLEDENIQTAVAQGRFGLSSEKDIEDLPILWAIPHKDHFKLQLPRG